MKRYIKSSYEYDNDSYFHVQGYNEVGTFVNETFDVLDEALDFFDSIDWQDGDCVEERFLPNKREYIIHRCVNMNRPDVLKGDKPVKY